MTGVFIMELISGAGLSQSIDNRIAHWHDRMEVIEVKKGIIICQIDGDEYEINAGDICIVNSRVIHSINADDFDAEIYRYEISKKLFTRDEDINKRYLNPMITDEKFSHIILENGAPITDEVGNLLSAIRDITDKKQPAYELAVVGIVHLLMQKIYNYYERDSREAPISADNFIYRKMADYIYNNYMEKLSLEDIAKKGNVSKSKACSLFNKFAKTSPVDFLNLYRLKISADLLKNTDSPISEIAMDSGFNQPSYFNRLFMREYKMTPSEFRKSQAR